MDCHIPIPKIISYYPKEVSIYGEVLISFKIDKPQNYISRNTYCHFGPRFVIATYIDNSTIQCNAPSNPPGLIPISISFDCEHWSNETFLINYKENYYNFIKIFYLLILFIFILSFILIFLHYSLNLRSKSEQEETIPLNRWYMHYAQKGLGEEKRIMDFLYNVLFN